VAHISDLLLEQIRTRPVANRKTDSISELGRQLSEVLRADPLVRLPVHLVLIARVAGLLSGVAYSLAVRPNFAPMLLPYLMPPV